MATDTWKPSRADYLEALMHQNPWNALGHVPEQFAKPKRRVLADELWRAMTAEPARYQLVMGPRRVGKTVALYQTIQRLLDSGVPANRLWFLRLDHPLLMHYELGPWATSLIKNYKATPASPLFLFLDEVNYSKQWDKWLKTFYDEKWPLRIVATSSSTAALRHSTIESGIGRWSEQFLTPYTFAEFLLLRGIDFDPPKAMPTLYETLCGMIEAKPDHSLVGKKALFFLLVGGFPELWEFLKDDDMHAGLFRSQQILRSEAVQRVTGMDIPQAYDIREPIALERLLCILAAQMCGLMNVQKLGESLSLSRSTVHQYINYLEQAYLIFTLPNFSNNESSIQKKGRKVFFVDGAVRNAALQRGLSPLGNSTEEGHLKENAAAAHLYALSLQSGQRLFHWRNGDLEVDLVYGDPGQTIAVEVTSGDHHLKGLRAIQTHYPELRNRCFLVSANSEIYSPPSDSNDGIGRIPLHSFLLAVGSQTREALCRKLQVN